MSIAKLILMLVCLMFVATEPKEAKVTPVSTTDLQDLPGKEGLTLLVEYPPGSSDPIHRHNAHAFVYVLEGSIVMQVRGGKETIVNAGQTFFLAQNGFRVVAHDRRGHGRSSQAWSGNDMNGYADDLAAVIEALDLKEVTLVGHSSGGGEVTRYIGRHGTKRVAAAVLISAVPPILVKSASNPEGIPIEVLDGLRSSLAKDRSQFWKDFAIMFFGANRPGAKVSQGLLDQFWLWSMQAGLKNSHDSIKAFSETDFTEDLKKFDVPTLVMHGEDDQVVPIKDSAKKSARLIKGAGEIYYPGLSHGLTATHPDLINRDLLAFIREGKRKVA